MEPLAGLIAQLEEHLYLSLFAVLVVCGLGLPLPEEMIFLAAGYAGRKLGADPLLLCLSGFCGVMVGDLVPYAIGRHFGSRLLRARWFARICPEVVRTHAEGFFRRRGASAIFLARFVAGLRTPVFMLAGALGTPLPAFVFWDGLGAALSCPACILLAYQVGPAATEWIARGHELLYWGLAVLAAAAMLAWKRRKPMLDGEAPAPGRSARFVYACCVPIARLLFRLFFRFRVEHPERLPRSGPVVVLANHGSFVDPVFLSAGLDRYVQYLMYSTFYDSWARPLFRWLAALPVKEDRYLQALKLGAKRLEAGACLGIFPEGAVSFDGRVLPAKPGALVLAQRSGAAVVPVTIDGSHAVLPRGAWFPRFKRVTIRVGEPFQVGPELSRPDLDALLARVMDGFARDLGHPAAESTGAFNTPSVPSGGSARP